MLSLSNLICNHEAGNEALRYGHTRPLVSPHASANGASHGNAHGSALLEATPKEDKTPRPVVVWAVTRACNLKCVHCYAAATAGPAENELTHEEGLNLLDDLKEFNVPAVLFSGGEPLSRPDTPMLIGYAQSIGLTCTLSTNGVLIDERMADRLAHLGLKYVGISLDGTRATHDKLRGVPGAFDATTRAIKLLRNNDVKVGVRYTITALNYDQLDSIFDYCQENKVQRLCVYHLAYSGRGEKMQRVDLTQQQTRTAVDRIMTRTKAMHAQGFKLEVLTVGNHADAAYALMQLEQTDPVRAKQIRERLEGTGGNRSGCNISSIDATGGVHYDQFSWHYTAGNIRDNKFSDIWTEVSDERLAILRNRRPHLPARCQACRFIRICNGNLRTRAEAATGNWLGMDPSCYLTEAETKI